MSNSANSDLKNFKPLSKRQINKLNRRRNEDSEMDDDNKSIALSSDYSSFLTSSTNITGDSLDSNNEFDLYKQDGSLVYIKQKYKMYLDWLTENSKSSKPKRGQKQLNWYSYEKHFHKNEYLRYLKSASIEEDKEKRPIENNGRPRFGSTNSLNLSGESSSFISAPSEIGSIERKESRPKGVKFESLNNLASGSFSSSISAGNLKPILKTSQPNDSQNPYIKNRLSANSRKRSSQKVHVKFPPILVQCSEDFYAVLNDLEKEKLV